MHLRVIKKGKVDFVKCVSIVMQKKNFPFSIIKLSKYVLVKMLHECLCYHSSLFVFVSIFLLKNSIFLASDGGKLPPTHLLPLAVVWLHFQLCLHPVGPSWGLTGFVNKAWTVITGHYVSFLSRPSLEPLIWHWQQQQHGEEKREGEILDLMTRLGLLFRDGLVADGICSIATLPMSSLDLRREETRRNLQTAWSIA